MADQAAPGTLRFQVLGPLRAWRGDSELHLGQAQQRTVLSALLLHANHPLSREQLMKAVWGPTSPTRAVNLLQRHASGLRRVLDPGRSPREPSDVLRWTEAGYRLTVPANGLDLIRFDHEVVRAHAARAAGELSTAAEALHNALGLWRGQVCEGLSSPLIDAERDRLEERRRTVTEERIELDLALGSTLDLVGELRQLLVDHPLRENLHGLLMLALHRSGHRTEALAAFRQARLLLHDELGIEPCEPLQRMHEQILTADPALDAPQPPALNAGAVPVEEATAQREPVIPAQLPHRTVGFTGRADVLARLNALVPAEGCDPCGAAVIAAIGGTAGVGKTALAIHWAHEVRDRFPDGQLYVNLRGFDPSGPAMEPAAAIRGFLDAFTVPPEQIPVDPAAQAALYRSLLANRRVLVVLDNARDAEQVRPLLPGSSGCLVIVTSRNQLAGLVATDGAHPVALDLLSPAEARSMLSNRIGRQCLSAEWDAVDDIITSCARLPLALAIVAARATLSPQFPLAALAKELHTVNGGLDCLDGGDDVTNIRAVFSWSYQQLTPPAARLFRLLGQHPAPDIDALAAAALAGVPPAQVKPPLAELSHAQLITECMPGRFTRHDLLRAYAAELSMAHDPNAERHAALHRMLDYYLHTAYQASLLLNPYRDDHIAPAAADPSVVVGQFEDHHRALAWFATEHNVLLAVLQQAADSRFDVHAWQLAWTLTPFFDRRSHWHDAASAHRIALETARRQGNTHAQAVIHVCLAYAYLRLGRYQDTHDHAEQALTLFAELGDAAGQAHAHRTLAWALDRQCRYREALPHAEQALELFGVAGHRTGRARALNAVGWFVSQLGNHEEGLTYCRRALELQKELGDRFDQADTWDSLGFVYRHLDRCQEAIACYEQALDLYREIGDQYNEADTLCSLGDSHYAIGETQAALAAWRHALTILDSLSHPDAAQVRAKLNDVRQ
ncbi:AfsR/SARP family transcriptional regulator [Streptomyces ochraceiscleroticus]|uniref:BTAD domain-containing putative transcriptional regulator n=1 Tax=Streptomyces ochraceiscleroticus TaxID=47761 RepID=A0ABW1MKW9_9ACTN|nr:BTAD domain-containing putative transcriptional regulator [Streptomyces ochraceiscleroticus]